MSDGNGPPFETLVNVVNVPRVPRDPTPAGNAARRFFASSAVEVILGVLIVASAALTVLETTELPNDARIAHASQAISALFAIELFVRFRIAGSTKSFFREWAIDVVSILPLASLLWQPFSEHASEHVPPWL